MYHNTRTLKYLRGESILFGNLFLRVYHIVLSVHIFHFINAHFVFITGYHVALELWLKGACLVGNALNPCDVKPYCKTPN